MSNLSMLVYIEHDAARRGRVLAAGDHNEREPAAPLLNTIVYNMVNIKGKKIALLGFAYKPDTSDCRQSPAIDIAHAMLAEGARLSICDPQVPAESITAALAGDHSSLQVGRLSPPALCFCRCPPALARLSRCWRGCANLRAWLRAAEMLRRLLRRRAHPMGKGDKV